MADIAQRDQNHITTLLAVSSVDGVSPVSLYADPTTHRLLVDLPAGSGTVTSVSVVTANGVSGSVATATTTPAITLTLGAITPSSVQVSGLTASELLATDASKNLVSLAVATYPSPTELSYVKGVTSAIQTQLGTKAPTTAPTFATSITGSYLTASEILITDASKNIVSAPVATYPSLTELTYVKGVTSAIQTQLGAKASTALDNLGTVAINTTLASDTDNTDDLGTTLKKWANLFVTTIGATATRVTKGWFTDIESTNMPTVGGTAILTSLTAPQFTTIELGHATDTTISRVSAGVIAVEGVTVPTISSTSTFTNKSIGAGVLQLEENASIALDPAGSADGKYSGITISGTAGATLAFGDVIVLDVTASKWLLADANSAAAADGDARGLIGMCVLAAADTETTTILLNGTCRADANFPALTITAPVYLSETAGDIVVAQPTTTDVVIRTLGFALTADEIYFNPSSDYVTHI